MNTQDRTGRTGPDASRPSEGMRRATGRNREQWFAVLDDWGAAGRPYREIQGWLMDEHDLSRWWAQKLIVEYEQARGLRPAGRRPDGTLTVGVSKTVNVPVERLFEAFVDATVRERWLPGAVMHERTSRPARSARFDWEDGTTRVNVVVTAMGDTKSQVGLEHERLPDTETADETKAFWQKRMAVLKAELEGGTP